MAQTKILVDTNSYLRLAESIHPLLFTQFGKSNYCLYVIPELNVELNASHLTTKFSWVDEAEYRDNRKHFPTIGRKQLRKVEINFEYIWEHIETELPGPSRVDATYIAYALELDICVVTDDEDMIELAKVFDVTVMRSLELMKLMLDSGHINIKKINSIVTYWRHIKDTPGRLDKLYRQLFGTDPP